MNSNLKIVKTSRRLFIKKVSLGIAALGLSDLSAAKFSRADKNEFPVVISTWPHGLPANEGAWKILSANGYALDAVESGVRISEADPGVNSVGYGGFPDSKGKVTLDACIMDEKGNAGSVAFLQNIKHPVSVARRVMEETPHVMLSGRGAYKFAIENGFPKEKLLTREMHKNWKIRKKEKREFSAEINSESSVNENHDTISMLATDNEGRICGACTTSGLAYKMHGRVGDSPIIGAGLFVDGEVGGAAATGTGELVMKTLGSFLIVEFMRNGMSPQKACDMAILRITEKIPEYEKYQIGFIALSKTGETGASSIHPGFEYAIKTRKITKLTEANSLLKKL